MHIITNAECNYYIIFLIKASSRNGPYVHELESVRAAQMSVYNGV